MRNVLIGITGPTASGKTKLSIDLAKELKCATSHSQRPGLLDLSLCALILTKCLKVIHGI